MARCLLAQCWMTRGIWLEIERYSECILLVFIEILNESAGEDVVVGQ